MAMRASNGPMSCSLWHLMVKTRQGGSPPYPMTLLNAHDLPEIGSSDDLKGLDILLVEDSRSVGKAVKSLLELLGAAVVGPAANTAEAERLLSEHAPDVALVDFHLRGGELSYGLIARLHDQGMPVIVVSGSSEFFRDCRWRSRPSCRNP